MGSAGGSALKLTIVGSEAGWGAGRVSCVESSGDESREQGGQFGQGGAVALRDGNGKVISGGGSMPRHGRFEGRVGLSDCGS